MSKLPTCPPIVPPAFEPSTAARDELARAERALADASAAARTAVDNARSSAAATSAATQAFGDEDSDERWRSLEEARRRETSAQLRAERCTTELADAERALQAARAAIEAEHRLFRLAQASPAAIARLAAPALLDVVRGMALLIRAARRFDPLRRLNSAAQQALSADDAARSSWNGGAVECAFRAAAGLAQVECGAGSALVSTGRVSLNAEAAVITEMIAGIHPDQLPPDVATMLREALAQMESE